MAAIRLVNLVFDVLYYLILARAILSFIAVNPYDTGSFLSQARRVVIRLTEPLLAPLRRVIPPVRAGAGYLDLTPIIALIGLSVLRNLLLMLLRSFI